MRHTEQEGAGGREEEVMLAAELATRAYRKSEMMLWMLLVVSVAPEALTASKGSRVREETQPVTPPHIEILTI